MVQVQNGIINFQRNRLDYVYKNLIQTKELDELLYNHQLAWELLFFLSGDFDMNALLTDAILEGKPNSPVVRAILYVYSMNTFIPKELN